MLACLMQLCVFSPVLKCDAATVSACPMSRKIQNPSRNISRKDCRSAAAFRGEFFLMFLPPLSSTRTSNRQKSKSQPTNQPGSISQPANQPRPPNNQQANPEPNQHPLSKQTLCQASFTATLSRPLLQVDRPADPPACRRFSVSERTSSA
jgi:hypothetical protein